MTNETQECPEEAVLDSLARGELGVGEIEKIERHVQDCTSCTETLAAHRLTEEYGSMLRESRERFAPELRRRVIRTATRICSDRPKPDAQ